MHADARGCLWGWVSLSVLLWIPGPELSSPGLRSKLFTRWAISLAPRNFHHHSLTLYWFLFFDGYICRVHVLGFFFFSHFSVTPSPLLPSSWQVPLLLLDLHLPCDPLRQELLVWAGVREGGNRRHLCHFWRRLCHPSVPVPRPHGRWFNSDRLIQLAEELQGDPAFWLCQLLLADNNWKAGWSA